MWGQRALSLLLAVAVAVTLTEAPAARRAAAATTPVAAAPAATPCPAERANLASAAVSAKLCGKPVEALDRRTETTQVFANPDGTITEDRALAPVRVHDGATWQDVDLTLVKTSDGAVEPRVHARDLRLSGKATGAGENEVVSLGSGEERTAVSWKGALPEPVLDGPTATYPEVLRGVDLVVKAGSTGYEQYFVAKDRAALRKVAKLTLPMSTGKLTATDDGMGGLTFKDRKGRAVGRAQAPEMWDATVAPRAGEHVNRARVGLRTTARGAGKAVMELTADPAFVDRADLTFPVTIDPPASLPVAFDAFVQNSYSSDQSGVGELKLGHVVDGGTYTARSYLRFATTGIWGSRITSAKLRLWNFHSWSCTAASWEAWRTDRADASVRWTNQPAAREKVGTSTETKGYNSSCGDGYVYIEVGKALQYAADNKTSDVTLMLRGTSETSSTSWKKFDSAEGAHPPVVSVTYNNPPAAPTGLAVAPCYSSCGAGARTSGVRPTLSAKLADSNAGQALRAEFEVRNKATAAVVATSGILTGNPGWTNGSTATWQVNANLANATTYQWRARGRDAYIDGAWTGWTDLTVDTDKPLVPHVSANVYFNDGQPHGGAGQADTFTFTPAAGTSDLAAFVYRLDSDASSTTVAATGAITRSISPPDGQRTLTVQAKDRAGNLSAANTYTFSAGNAALAQPIAGATVAKRTKLQIFTPVTGYTRAFYEYRRGPGAAILPVPSANLTSAGGAPITATSGSPVAFSALGGYAIWNASDTLGSVGGVVEVRARIYTATSTSSVYDTPWVRVTVDSSGDGAATEEVGPGEVNLLTGDFGQTVTDTEKLGLTVSRATSSRTTADGWTPMAEKLTANQQQVSTDLTGFTVPSTSTAVRSTLRGQGDVTPLDSVEITPAASGTSSNDTYVALGGDTGAMRLGMQAGKTYRATGWIYVPAATTLAPHNVERGLRIVGWHRTGTAGYVPVPSPMAGFTEGWQELSVDMTVPAGATEALFRLYNGNLTGSGKKVWWDNISVTEVVAPFGPSWNGGTTGGPAESDYTTLAFPSPSVAQLSTVGGGWITFSRNTDGSFTPEPGSEGLVLSRPDASTYRVTDLDGGISDLKQQGGIWTVTATRTGDDDSTTRYLYDTTGGRLLLKKVVNPVNPGVDDANGCTGATLPRGCEVLEYVHATATAAGLSDTVFGDYTDRVTAVRIWNWDPQAGAVNAVEVVRYAYDNLGRLREVWDPRVSPAVKTAYQYDGAGRVVRVTPAGEFPWMFDYANPDVDAAALRWNLDGNATDSSGAGRNGTATGVTWGEANDPANPGDRAAYFGGAATAQIAASGAALSNTAAYTVSAWARITDKSVNRTIVSKDGSRTSGFFLNYVQANDRWAFSRTTADNDSSTAVRATSNVAPTVGRWTHLAGVYDTASGRMKLYVDGVLQSTTAATGGWNATGTYVVGRAKWAGANANPWAGSIDDVRIYGAALTDAQVAVLAGDENAGRLVRVRRAALQQGSRTAADGETTAGVVYNVPLSRAAGGPHDMTAAAVGTWGQKDLPTDATAIFDPEAPPARHNASPSSPGAGGYAYAKVHYLNAGGREVNTATPGGHIDTEEYDRFGNVVRELDATDRLLALGTLPDAATGLAELGLLESDTATRALALSTVRRFSDDGVDELETVGPTVTTMLEDALADPDGSGPLEAVPAGETVIARAAVTKKYDEGKPDGATYHLVTSETQAARVDGYPEADRRVTRYGYDGHHGGASGWKLGTSTSTTADAAAGGAQLTAYGVYDQSGRGLRSWGFDSTGDDARTRVNVYYTAGANAADSACGNRPEWAGLACTSRAAAAVTGHDPDRASDSLPVRRVTRYSRFRDPEVTTETAGGKVRTTTNVYDAATRVVSASVTGDVGAAVETTTTTYDPATGEPAETRAGGAAIVRVRDMLGRMSSYTDADGGVTTHEYDRYGRAAKVTNPTGSVSYAYNRSAEPRGLATSITDSAAGTFGATYDADEKLVKLTYPGGLTRTDRLDANQQPVQRVYTRDADGEVIYAESTVENIAGQVVHDDYTGGAVAYTYDRLGRLIRSERDTDGAGCTTLTYAYDARSNRTARSAYEPAEDGSCRSTGAAVTESHTYDSADRLAGDGYTHDAFGRVTGMPGGLVNSFHVNDLVAAQTVDDSRQRWTLDPAKRARGFTTETRVDGEWTASSSKLNHYGDETDEPQWIVENTATGEATRMVSGPDGDLVATASAAGGVRLQLANLHGDVAATIDPQMTEPELYPYDEFGVRPEGQQSSGDRYGWLGAKQRSSEAFGGLIMMGVRLYAPALGRFLQSDPVDGGNANPYDYCSGDPVNCADLDGKLWGRIKKAAKGAWNFTKNNPALVAGTLSMFTPPPFNVAFGAAAVGFSAYSAYKNVRAGRYGAAAFDVLGAVPGGGSAFRGARAIRAGMKAKRLGRNVNRFKGYRGARKAKRAYVNRINRSKSNSKRHWRASNRWGGWDKRYAYPAAVGYTACKYRSSCQRRARWIY
ncbi:LamG-like jellyroll fold domain-containing protein [Actinoplanes sp. NPDC023714]|uniref:LamG-like jellyroll fold domain-containing protein n=1 Tax=Actinoplanes sp. NPDC023714 TaxID=3154322 RepID=UPI0033FD65FA